MGRTRAVAMVVAAVVGVTGGVAGAVGLTGSSAEQRAGSPSSPSAEESDDAAPAPPDEPLLFHAGQTIYDGDDEIDVRPTGPGARRLVQAAIPSTVTRQNGGYLLAFPEDTDLGEDVTEEDLWRVDAEGAAVRIATVAPGWDQDPEGTRVVGVDVAEGLLTVWDSATGEPVTRWDGEIGPQDSAAYAGSREEVLVSVRLDPRTYELRRWDVAAGTTTTEPLPGYDRMGVSPDGSVVAGTVGPDGAASDEQDFCLQAHGASEDLADVFWQTCDWRPERLGRPEFSPDGSRLLVVPSGEGTNPAEYAVLDAVAGPDPLVGRLQAPNGTVSATWADDDTLYLTGISYTEAAADFWVRRCTFDGACTDLPADAPGEVVVSELR